MLTEKEIATARATLNELQVEHRDLNLVVEQLAATPLPNQDQLLIQRLKKRKLALKDKIYQLEKMLVPDIPA
ncbi:MAG: YdcH family protein [Candidatus Accumulibacter sp.]|nr:YdcH family protein [Accumulibacter sp.]